MSMTKKDFIALAKVVRSVCGKRDEGFDVSMWDLRGELAAFCEQQNPRFNRQRWLDYIDGKCGPNGGKVKSVTEPKTSVTTCLGCKENCWDIAKVGQALNKCWNCGLRFDNE